MPMQISISNAIKGQVVGGTPDFPNTLSTIYDGIDEKTTISPKISRNGVLTFSFWFKFTGSFGVNTEVFIWGVDNDNTSYLQLVGATGVNLKLNGTIFRVIETGGNNISQNTWSQFVIIRDSSGSVQVYLNGATFGPSFTSANTLTFNSFGRVVNLSFGFKGNIDEAAFWFDDKTSDLSEIYNGGLPSDLTSLSPTNWWRMGDGSTYPTINDETGSLPMTMVNMSSSNFSTDVPT